MTPIFFGDPQRRLFGIYEPAQQVGARKRAALLCNAWGAEYIYAHRAMRLFASRLCAAGIHTLRFDYFGTGDSAGETEAADLAGCEADIETAMEELQDITGADSLILAGMRLGGSLAARVGHRLSQKMERLVLWDAILDGAFYVRHLKATNTEGVVVNAAALGDETDAYVEGFPLTASLRRDIAAIDLTGTLAALPVPALLVDSIGESTPEPREGFLQVRRIPAEMPWIEDTGHAGTVPVGAINAILDWLA